MNLPITTQTKRTTTRWIIIITAPLSLIPCAILIAYLLQLEEIYWPLTLGAVCFFTMIALLWYYALIPLRYELSDKGLDWKGAFGNGFVPRDQILGYVITDTPLRYGRSELLIIRTSEKDYNITKVFYKNYGPFKAELAKGWEEVEE